MTEATDELKALREQVAALRKEVADLRATTPRVHINGADQVPLGAFPVQPLPMPPYPYQPNTSDASRIWRYPTSAADPTPGA